MKKIYLYLLSIIKNNVDKLYYSQYTRDNGTLIRKMFPWVKTLTQQDYSVIENFLINTSPVQLENIVKVITTFYWMEANRHILANNIQWINKLQWLIELCESLTDFQRLYLAEKANDLNSK